jgi:hypothetical protein
MVVVYFYLNSPLRKVPGTTITPSLSEMKNTRKKRSFPSMYGPLKEKAPNILSAGTYSSIQIPTNETQVYVTYA